MARSVGKRYDHPFDGDRPYVTPSRIRRLGRKAQIQLITDWFLSLHEDPANETPYNGREGGYLYVHGGPYDARDVIEAEFIDYVDDDIISQAIDEVESDGTVEWAPSSRHPDRMASDNEAIASLDLEIDEAERPTSAGRIFGANGYLGRDRDRNSLFDHDQIDARLERGARTSFGTSFERAVRRSTLAHAADLQALLAKPLAKPKHGGIGHNQPPPEITLDQEHTEQLKEAVETISEELNAELRNEQPDVRKVSRAARAIQSIGNWVAQKLDMTLDAFLKTFAGGLAGLALLKLDVIIQETLKVYQSVIDWLNAVVLPF